jgi:hypothetical protein
MILTRHELQKIVGECAGAVSVCWVPRPLDQVFDSTTATKFVDEAVDTIWEAIHAD